jgi:fluoroacetyl-CoA thioesterase
MKDTLRVGLEHTTTHVVKIDDSAPHLSVPVLATPTMIAMIEYCCMQATEVYMDEGEATVGAHVCVSHERPTFVDEEYRIRAVLAKIEGARLTFDVTVENDQGRVSTGTHQRSVVDFSRFG